MPFFVRTRQLNIQRLDRKPQEGLEVVRTILSSSINDVLISLKALEKSFYGFGKDALDEIMKWTRHVNKIIVAAKISDLLSSSQIDDVLYLVEASEECFKADAYDVNKMKECHRKITHAVPANFNGILIKLRAILKYIEKYCLSFHNIDHAVCLDTANHYENKRQNYARTIRDLLDKVTRMPHKFKIAGLKMEDLSSYGKELASKASCSNSPFLVMFPEAVELCRAMCVVFSEWLDADLSYAAFVATDIKDLEQRKDHLVKLVRECSEKCYRLQFKIKQSEMDCCKLEQELERMTERESELMIDEELIGGQIIDLESAISISEYRREELIKRSSEMHPQILFEKFSEVSEILRNAIKALPGLKKEMAHIRAKLSCTKEKKNELRMERRKLKALQKELDESVIPKTESEADLDKTVKKLELARRIHLCKTCPDAMEKIFHERPVEVNNARLPGNKGKKDPFERACNITSVNLDSDWPKLYRNLPFHPSRGTTTIDRDIREFSNVGSRCGNNEIAMRAICRWRRFHTRANLEELKETLALINRHDVIQMIEDVLNPPKPKEDKDDYLNNPFITPDLLPFLKQVERFDKLRSENKI